MPIYFDLPLNSDFWVNNAMRQAYSMFANTNVVELVLLQHDFSSLYKTVWISAVHNENDYSDNLINYQKIIRKFINFILYKISKLNIEIAFL